MAIVGFSNAARMVTVVPLIADTWMPAAAYAAVCSDVMPSAIPTTALSGASVRVMSWVQGPFPDQAVDNVLFSIIGKPPRAILIGMRFLGSVPVAVMRMTLEPATATVILASISSMRWASVAVCGTKANSSASSWAIGTSRSMCGGDPAQESGNRLADTMTLYFPAGMRSPTPPRAW